MKIKWDVALTAALMVCALSTTGLVVYREFFARPASSPPWPEQRTVFVENWRAQLSRGVQLGPSSAPVKLIEFADFECPFCATFHTSLKTIRERYPTEVALSFVHFPLPTHRFALVTARVAECADAQGRFEEMHALLFEQQKVFGLKPWSKFAIEAGIPDLGAFESCVQGEDPVPRIVAGQQFGEELNIHGTPTLIINGWKLGRTPSMEELERMVNAILAGKSPVTGDGTPVE